MSHYVSSVETLGVTSPAGFKAAGTAAGISVKPGKKDLALVVNEGPSKAAAAVFTTNRFAAAPVLWSQQVLTDGHVDAVLLNSGGANACTGHQGFQDTHVSAELVAELLGISAGDVAVCSTGLIGERLPMDRVAEGIHTVHQQLATGKSTDADAAGAIMTTDTVSKQAGITLANGVTIGGMAKGAGMLAPGLATMLVIITTDAELDSSALDSALREAVRLSFNRADSDGCMSTNDTVLLMASGASQTTPDTEEFARALTLVCQDLAQQLIGDAEGASHDIHVRTFNAETEEQAEEVSRAVARSNLFKTAMFGNDPNWGRVLSEVGTTSATFEPENVNVSINKVQVCTGGGIGEPREKVTMEGTRLVTVDIDLGAGNHEATIITNDLTHDYVHENSAYSS
ncbi:MULTISPECIES: bifunctional glutamate N-acetyltransferase/amino-acid acetyltransferase ArgJ [unclassified Rothia (in: high G+C Gram-positive bacteria)]|uniref:bifunctional glutamate N-acetyltransferase/amino-acid acetyltransferase ArgJ n=1 Tax=unclassified Rothia (in: high G+C Gram-positive bacteria) TaxID=2689056 RepID=UPI00195934A8|nr:bifunctional glutamate N-acetyltransferase/amino-acid acetyltransferase ArgJ [Rothia sp. ZJ932]MBM7051255.1 bifunctional glutamate N-acetyltransferase/amino-acid acetyltransferase ArgJ [Rothia sp. ZJ1223]QRZ61051.1 bifunctional glutamate N-acetyltransferase/amino-acid acetyltransferase ArgJ [Rothia sp. ZJ932]